VRFLDGGKLFLGLGLGFEGASRQEPNGNEQSQSGFTFSPLFSYDLLDDMAAALSLLGWLNIVSVGDTEDCPNNGGCNNQNDGASAWGLNVGAGIRGKLSEGLAIGGEFGWGFLDVSYDNNNEYFLHGLWGNIVFEASVGL